MKPDKPDRQFPFPDLSYKMIGSLFKVHNILGNSLGEKYYQRALAKEFKSLGINFRQEVPIEIQYVGEPIGKHQLDFLIEDCLILETKTIPAITPKSLTQLVSYLKSTGLQVGILANFRTQRLTYRRVINPLIR